jgi:UV DNA damage repair endonuclease
MRKLYRLSSSILTLSTVSRKTCTPSTLCIFIEIKDRGQMSRQMIEICLDIIVCQLAVVLWSLFVRDHSDIFKRKFYRLSSSILILGTVSRKTCTPSTLCIFIEIKDRGQMSRQMIEICLNIIVCPLAVVLWSCGAYRVIFL